MKGPDHAAKRLRIIVRRPWIRRPKNLHPQHLTIARQMLWDPLGNYHNKSCTFALVDGHAEHHKWRDNRTMVFMSDRQLADDMGFGKNVEFVPRNVDLDWLDAHYPAKTRLKGGD